MQKYSEWRKEDGQAEGLFKFSYVDADSTLEFVKRDEHLQTVLTQAENELVLLRTQLQECRLLLEQARDERNEAREERDAMKDTVDRNNGDIALLEVRLQDAAAEHQELAEARRRVFQLEAGGEQIDAWIRAMDPMRTSCPRSRTFWPRSVGPGHPRTTKADLSDGGIERCRPRCDRHQQGGNTMDFPSKVDYKQPLVDSILDAVQPAVTRWAADNDVEVAFYHRENLSIEVRARRQPAGHLFRYFTVKITENF